MVLNIYKKVLTYLGDLENLAFPNVCSCCSNVLFTNEESICTRCIVSLPMSYYYDNLNNDLFKSLWGRINLEFAISQYIFKKGNKIQKLLHSIKYDNRKDAAFIIGKLIGKELKNYDPFHSVDYILPVPLHPAKQAKRGYNQSGFICDGISSITGVATRNDFLVRVENTNSQTKKNRYERWENMEYGFSVRNADCLIDKHVLIVDDVITTGATLEGCSIKLSSIKGIKISVASIAHAI